MTLVTAWKACRRGVPGIWDPQDRIPEQVGYLAAKVERLEPEQMSVKRGHLAPRQEGHPEVLEPETGDVAGSAGGTFPAPAGRNWMRIEFLQFCVCGIKPGSDRVPFLSPLPFSFLSFPFPSFLLLSLPFPTNVVTPFSPLCGV